MLCLCYIVVIKTIKQGHTIYRKTKISILAISSIMLTFVLMPVFAEQWSESWGVKYSPIIVSFVVLLMVVAAGVFVGKRM